RTASAEKLWPGHTSNVRRTRVESVNRLPSTRTERITGGAAGVLASGVAPPAGSWARAESHAAVPRHAIATARANAMPRSRSLRPWIGGNRGSPGATLWAATPAGQIPLLAVSGGEAVLGGGGAR